MEIQKRDQFFTFRRYLYKLTILLMLHNDATYKFNEESLETKNEPKYKLITKLSSELSLSLSARQRY